MDGLRADADILFVLTTNRPEDIEDALASRPGRVDEAIEVPLPDDVCRQRLIALYGRALAFEDGAVAEAVSRSEGASAAFMKEMVRRLAQDSLARDSGREVLGEDVARVFGDVVSNPSRMSRRIVGMTGNAEEGALRRRLLLTAPKSRGTAPIGAKGTKHPPMSFVPDRSGRDVTEMYASAPA